MNFRRSVASGLVLLISFLLAVPADVVAQSAQSAGKITAVVPIVNLISGAKQVPASTSLQVFWGDIINTGHLARARVALNDGSILNVGSDSNLTVTQHDAAAQQTDLELNYGRVRANAVKLVKPKASFQIRTPTGVAGVVGTDFEISSDQDTTRVVVFEGKVNFCSYSTKKKPEGEQASGAEQEGISPNTQENDRRHLMLGPCVIVAAGATSSVRFNEAPSQPVPATPLTVADAMNSTAPSGGGGAGAGGGISGGAASGAGAAGGGVGAATGVVAGVSAAVAAAVAAVVVRSVSKTPTCPAAGANTTGQRALVHCTPVAQAGTPR